LAGLGQGGECFRHQRVIDEHAHALLCRAVIDDALVARVAVFAQHERLDGELDAVGIPGDERAVGVFARGAALVIDRRDPLALGLDDVDPGDQPVLVAREFDAAGVNRLARGGQFGGGREGAFSLVDFLVPQRPFDRLAVVGKYALDPFIIEQPRAIDELVEHPCGEILGKRSRSNHGSNSARSGLRRRRRRARIALWTRPPRRTIH
jgi:hypothetical protein